MSDGQFYDTNNGQFYNTNNTNYIVLSVEPGGKKTQFKIAETLNVKYFLQIFSLRETNLLQYLSEPGCN